VMRSVRSLWRYKYSADGMRGRAEWRSGLLEAPPVVAAGLTSMAAGSGGHSAGCMPVLTKRVARGGLKVDAI